ncbi:hypothetical protein A2334_03500 [Candidatus Roizmanbacteria bacterium RIFOXYB2_FULL_38_10]|uniref:Uncharacterized protein n=1 Tax=Candidatus Roizmanbacteria bacterium RIFOXYD1_FULL_38_12 TaxID=1802093 RepID=A0A1F7L0Y6_9BACT|nr:MAG: hypothetical protein A3K47_03345 [Candidatus Roizmanbacteria bacterium RIFOXYA2_FULL_38_14]OGK63799.1 MAG: hypothetical protein A3K27_03345 [Candidatus Roizmanbacteria bacterium RIFOXYA1_FULL_37_12]OGK65645.1 MAG: hypothetical protein A3K38_03345 [Candidatus Roizmanbacteria bacterium RIFOXYB1_FULL_40_23]OGK67467.1 MAG: hypothetical protein A2334_03500 [Candidatus Roizmanbacteria bacterium RIFOXYB2_FULL_38_10]OGK70050.1 MAG: hypothetical protein A3K21_03350 [Candidatus Roizmanbacteria ba
MNEHLEPIFRIFLTGLEESEIDYWVYGGIAVAALVGRFIRKNGNRDVDIFVKEIEMDNVRSILESRCYDQDLIWNECRPFKKDGFSRRKLEVRRGRDELLSIVPVFLTTSEAILVFRNGAKKYSKDILKRVERKISGNVFYTSSDTFIRKIFKDTFRGKRNWRKRSEIMEDAKTALTPEEFRQYFQQ